MLTGALRTLVPALDAAGGSIRLLQRGYRRVRGRRLKSAPPTSQPMFQGIASAPTERVIATRRPSVVDDLAAEAPAELDETLPVRQQPSACRCWSRTSWSARSSVAAGGPVPVRAGRRAAARDHRRPDRRRGAERAAARLRAPRQAGVGAHVRRDRRSDRRLRQPRPAAARQHRARARSSGGR